MSWRDRPMVGFDLETTGIDVETARIVTACVGVAGRTGWSPRNWLLQQSEPIPQEATDIHRITTEYANDYGTAPAPSLTEIAADLYQGWDMGMPIIGHNVVYDLTVLDRNLRRHDLAPLEVRGPVICTMVADKLADRYRKSGRCKCGRCGGTRRLVDVAAHYGVPIALEDAHGAEKDALTACRIAWMLGASWVSLEGITDELRIAYAEQQAYFLKRDGLPHDAYTLGWPLKPLPLAAQAVA